MSVGTFDCLTLTLDQKQTNLAKIAQICGKTTCPEYAELNKALA